MPSTTPRLVALWLLLATAAVQVQAICPSGYYEDRQQRCWRPVSADGRSPTYTFVQANANGVGPNGGGTVVLLNGNGNTAAFSARYTRHNNPTMFFDAHGAGGVNPLRGSAGQRHGVPFIPGLDWSTAARVRVAHGVMAALAFVGFFPAGAITVALLPGIVGTVVHAAFQMVGFVFYLVAVIMGLWLATVIRWRNFNFYENYHPILGILVFIVVLAQPITGLLHHAGFRRNARRGFASYVHVWVGRVFVTLGIINGGLGLYVAGNATGGQVMAYALVAAIVFVVWMIAAAWGEVKRWRGDVPPVRMRRNREPGMVSRV